MKFLKAIFIFCICLQSYVFAMENALITPQINEELRSYICQAHNENLELIAKKHQHNKNSLFSVIDRTISLEDAFDHLFEEEDEGKHCLLCCCFTNTCAFAGSVSSMIGASSLSKCLVVTAGFGGGIAGALCGCLFCTMVRFTKKMDCR